jgi:hypothetical protein
MTVAVSSAAMRSILKDLDVHAAKRAWGEPDDAKTLVMLHMARTAAKSIPMGLRAYSHRWLVDHGLPSQLPDELKPKAERMYPQVVSAVGIAVKMRDAPWREPAWRSDGPWRTWSSMPRLTGSSSTHGSSRPA